jgi:hypothetical protein
VTSHTLDTLVPSVLASPYILERLTMTAYRPDANRNAAMARITRTVDCVDSLTGDAAWVLPIS